LEPLEVPQKKEQILWAWQRLSEMERFVFNKLITGGFRIGVSQQLMVKALAKHADVKENIVAHRLMGNWSPDLNTFQELLFSKDETDFSKPYPFYLAYPIEGDVSNLGDVKDWSIEHKWDGIRSQTIIRENQIFVWSRGEELVTDKYPEFQALVGVIPNGTVIDAEILAFANGEIGTFNDLQSRIGRKTISANMLKSNPVILKAYDLLEWEGNDIRNLPYHQRRLLLEKLFHTINNKNLPFYLSERKKCITWKEVENERMLARDMRSEGLMLKRNDSTYQVGRKKGDWWKWKLEPLVIDAVLTYAMRGSGRRTNLFTDYTFALWQNNLKGERELVTFAKAYSGLTDAEFRKVDDFIKKNTLDRFGPVRSVKPHLVFEIGFEGIALSKRHKSGVATRFPRIIRWRQDKKIEDANTIDDLKNMIL
jgi:DNA ligase-1